ncbi:uncharacterized protein LOC117167911 [Belonocnema kinseyi]|uniref:uncharacterized protein LOC117167911 n=1 Tax=Belonocnema kinseyi TaxID=2817044 RepID=UPI00143D29B4|nr:uncharacterized protein LOC117167911 [Belonocnema kinseyi]
MHGLQQKRSLLLPWKRPFLSSMGGIAANLSSAILLDKPLRFTDSPQHHTSKTGSNAPTPCTRRKSTSNEDTYSSKVARIERMPIAYMGSALSFPDYGSPMYSVSSQEYYRPPEPGYFVSSDYHDRNFECSEFPHSYDSPNSIISPARPSPRTYIHHRTSSNVSNASTSSQSNINPTFRLEDESDYALYSPSHHYRHGNFSNVTNYSSNLLNQEYSLQYLTRQNSHDSNPNSRDRASNLEVVSRLRSSLRRSTYSYSPLNKTVTKINSGSGTLTNPTPPDSLTSEDSSYVSANGSQISAGRVRFSPVTIDRDSISIDNRETLLDIPVHIQSQDITIPLQVNRSVSRNCKRSVPDLEMDSLL